MVAVRDISIIIPVYRETDAINRTIDCLRADDPRGSREIIVVDGDPGAGTIAAIRDPHVVVLTSSKGRACQMNAGAAVAHGDVLLFLHADTVLPPGGLDEVARAMTDPRIVGGSFRLGFDSARRSHAWLAWLASLRSRVTGIPLGDHGIFLRRSYFQTIGGYRPLPLMEDVDLIRRIRRRGDRIRILGSCVRTSTRRFEVEGIVFCAARSIVLYSLFWLGVPATRLARYYPDVRSRARGARN